MNTTKSDGVKVFDWTNAKALVANSPLAERIYKHERLSVCQQTDRMFGWLMITQWLASILVALIVSPFTWAGRDAFIHPHIFLLRFLVQL